MGDAFRSGVGRRLGNQRRVICRIDKTPADPDHEQDDGRLQDDDDSVDEGGLFCSANQSSVRRKRINIADVNNPGRSGCVVSKGECTIGRKFSVRTTLERGWRLAPGCRDGGGRDRTQNQVPADNPCDEFAHRRIRIV